MTGGAAHADAALFTLLGESLAADILGPRANLDTLSPGAEDVRAVTVEGMAARVGIARLVVNGLPGSGNPIWK